MTSPSEITPGPGQVAYEEWQRRFDGCVVEDWHRDLADSERSDWSGVASAVLAAAAPEVAEDDPATRLLALPLPPNDSGASTVGGYLTELLVSFWGAGEEGLDGKKPFGNSGWRAELYLPMAGAGLVEAGDEEAADALILAAIERMGQS